MNDLGGIVPFNTTMPIAAAFLICFSGEYVSHFEKLSFALAIPPPLSEWQAMQEFLKTTFKLSGMDLSAGSTEPETITNVIATKSSGRTFS